MKELFFGERVKELRTEKGLTQDQLGEIFNVRGATISRWESGQIEPDFRTLLKLADFFEVSLDYLLGDN